MQTLGVLRFPKTDRGKGLLLLRFPAVQTSRLRHTRIQALPSPTGDGAIANGHRVQETHLGPRVVLFKERSRCREVSRLSPVHCRARGRGRRACSLRLSPAPDQGIQRGSACGYSGVRSPSESVDIPGSLPEDRRPSKSHPFLSYPWEGMRGDRAPLAIRAPELLLEARPCLGGVKG